MSIARSVRFVARVMLAVLLFAQAALAVAACDWLRRAPAQVFVAAEAPTCHEAPAKNANLCLAHCLGGYQSADTPALPIAAFAATPVLLVAVASVPALARDVRGDVLPPEPPPRIRFHSFRV